VGIHSMNHKLDKAIKIAKKDVQQMGCLSCHVIPKDRDVVLRSDENIMPLLGKHGTIKAFGSIACITCHEANLWQPLMVNKTPKPSLNKKNREGTVKNSYLRRLGVIDSFCVDCHSLEALPKYKYYHDKDKVRNIGVDYLK